jgi:hypothetical protein
MNFVWHTQGEREENCEHLNQGFSYPIRVAPKLVEYSYISGTLYHTGNLSGLKWCSFLNYSCDFVTKTRFSGS